MNRGSSEHQLDVIVLVSTKEALASHFHGTPRLMLAVRATLKTADLRSEPNIL